MSDEFKKQLDNKTVNEERVLEELERKIEELEQRRAALEETLNLTNANQSTSKKLCKIIFFFSYFIFAIDCLIGLFQVNSGEESQNLMDRGERAVWMMVKIFEFYFW